MSSAVGDIAGSAYEGRSHRTKDYNRVKMFSSRARFTDDTLLLTIWIWQRIFGSAAMSILMPATGISTRSGWQATIRSHI